MKWFRAIVTLLAIAPTSAALASADPLIEGAKLCTRHLPHYEREYAIPTHLLSAIATTESGRYHEGLKMKLPWPWAINAGGKGYFFDTKEDAMAAVRKLHKHGVQSIDVGCMQVNIYQHPEAFSSLSEAFEPKTNIAYAAGFLRDLHAESGTWKKAAADYHSRTPSLGREYVSQVYESWYTIIDRLRAARSELSGKKLAKGTVSTQPYQMASTAPGHVHMNSINVTTVDTARNNQPDSITVVRGNVSNLMAYNGKHAATTSDNPAPVIARVGDSLATLETKPAAKTDTKSEVKTADSTPLQSPLPTPVQTIAITPVSATIDADAVALSALNPSAGRRSLNASPAPRTGPNFIFND